MVDEIHGLYKGDFVGSIMGIGFVVDVTILDVVYFGVVEVVLVVVVVVVVDFGVVQVVLVVVVVVVVVVEVIWFAFLVVSGIGLVEFFGGTLLEFLLISAMGDVISPKAVVKFCCW